MRNEPAPILKNLLKSDFQLPKPLENAQLIDEIIAEEDALDEFNETVETINQTLNESAENELNSTFDQSVNLG